jgi:D-alanyl-D-alanine carboxypeptidase
MKGRIAIILLIVIGGLAYSVSDFKSHNMKTIKNFLEGQVDKGNTPSIQYIFFDSESAIFEHRYGLRNVKSETPVDSATMYHLFSVTKTFTALSVLQLVQAGKIDLKNSIADYLPEFPYSKAITIEQLLSHTAGIPNPLPLRWIHLVEDHPTFNRNEFFQEVFRHNPKLDSEPGTKFKYSNLGYVILGQLVEKISGLTLEDYIRRNIIERIGVVPNHLGFQIDPSVQATGYHKWFSGSNAILGFLIDKRKFMGEREGKWKPFHHFYNNGTAYGGLVGTGNALVKYGQALLGDKTVLLNNQYKDILFTERTINHKPTGMSLAWYTGTLKGNRYYAHAGGGGGYYVELRIYPDLGAGSVILYNRSGMTDERILDRADSFFVGEPASSRAGLK